MMQLQDHFTVDLRSSGSLAIGLGGGSMTVTRVVPSAANLTGTFDATAVTFDNTALTMDKS